MDMRTKDPHMLNMLRTFKARAARIQAEYEAECEAWRRDGFSPAFCIHGVYLWGDYDCQCWGCEEYGNCIPSMAPYRKVRELYLEHDERYDQIRPMLAALRGKYDSASDSARSALIKWAYDPILNY